ncbi:MAG: hypothetical protein R2849_21110 [Thermomicrobiales bacterium]
MRNLFGTITESHMRLNSLGRIVQEEWLRCADVRESIELDSYVVMPNHFHGILMINAPDPHEGIGSEGEQRIALQVQTLACLAAVEGQQQILSGR